jgi:hypothetical protein
MAHPPEPSPEFIGNAVSFRAPAEGHSAEFRLESSTFERNRLIDFRLTDTETGRSRVSDTADGTFTIEDAPGSGCFILFPEDGLPPRDHDRGLMLRVRVEPNRQYELRAEAFGQPVET